VPTNHAACIEGPSGRHHEDSFSVSGGKINLQKTADIQQLMEVTGMKTMMTQMVASKETRWKPTIVARAIIVTSWPTFFRKVQ
jgi:hypothetical protein